MMTPEDISWTVTMAEMLTLDYMLFSEDVKNGIDCDGMITLTTPDQILVGDHLIYIENTKGWTGGFNSPTNYWGVYCVVEKILKNSILVSRAPFEIWDTGHPILNLSTDGGKYFGYSIANIRPKKITFRNIFKNCNPSVFDNTVVRRRQRLMELTKGERLEERRSKI